MEADNFTGCEMDTLTRPVSIVKFHREISYGRSVKDN
jgi:hypothetical protein